MFESVTPPELSGAPLDRCDHLRADAGAIARLWQSSAARVLVFSKGNPMLRDDGQLATVPSSHALAQRREPVYLGEAQGVPWFAVAHGEIAPEPGCDFHEMRGALLGGFAGDEATIAAGAKALLNWHHSHGFCARCGAQSRMVNAGWRRDCPSCGGQHFPRTDPVVIMLIERGARCTIARNVSFPEGLYSCIAGFVEPGESIEAAVRRESLEELGLRIGRVAYVSSQPWPFPSSLMLGCIAEALDEAFTLEQAEIADARWFTRDEVRRIFAGEFEGVLPPRGGAIARTLLLDWLEGRIGFA